MFVSKCFIPHPGRDMYLTLSHLRKVKEGIQSEMLEIETKHMNTIYNWIGRDACVWQKNVICSSALREETRRHHLFSELLVNSHAHNPRTNPVQPHKGLPRGAQPFVSPLVTLGCATNGSTWFFHVLAKCQCLVCWVRKCECGWGRWQPGRQTCTWCCGVRDAQQVLCFWTAWHQHTEGMCGTAGFGTEMLMSYPFFISGLFHC